jgi:hypothetical protein
MPRLIEASAGVEGATVGPASLLAVIASRCFGSGLVAAGDRGSGATGASVPLLGTAAFEGFTAPLAVSGAGPTPRVGAPGLADDIGARIVVGCAAIAAELSAGMGADATPDPRVTMTSNSLEAPRDALLPGGSALVLSGFSLARKDATAPVPSTPPKR